MEKSRSSGEPMVGIVTACTQTTEFLSRHGIFSAYEPSGQFALPIINARPLIKRDELMAMHYGQLRGPLYADPGQWECFYQVVKSFCKGQRTDTSCIFDDVWGGIPAPLSDVLDVLPSAFALQQLQMASQSASARETLFRASESCLVKELPEPYGKWLQHRELQAKWEKTQELQMWAVCKLSSPQHGMTRLRIEGSTFFVTLLVRLARSLTEQLGLSQPLGTSLDYLRTKVTFRLRNRALDLSRLI